MISLQQYLPFVVPFLGTLPFVIIFLLILWSGVYGMIKSKASKNWPSTTGHITDSFIKEKQKKNRIKYKPKVEYIYNVKSREYKSTNINFGGRIGLRSREEAEEYMKPFQKDTDIRIFYNPRNPQEACLLPGEGVGGIATVVGVVGLAVFSIIWMDIFNNF